MNYSIDPWIEAYPVKLTWKWVVTSYDWLNMLIKIDEAIERLEEAKKVPSETMAITV